MEHEYKNPHAVALGTLGGRSKSEAKQRSSRNNGKLGGRPKRVPTAVLPNESGKMVRVVPS